jgi:hypothetical protein
MPVFLLLLNFLKKKATSIHMKLLHITVFIVFISTSVFGQKAGYEHYKNVPPPHFSNSKKEKKFRINGLIVSPENQYILVDYRHRGSTLAIFSYPDFEVVAMQRFEKAVELSQSYFYANDSLLYIKTDRYAPDYTMLRIHDNRPMKVPCERTPKGCPTDVAGLAKIRTYSADMKFLFQRADDKITLEVFQKQ